MVGAVVAVWLVPPVVYRPADQAEARAALQAGLLTAAAAMVAVAGALVALAETRRANENTHVRELYTRAVDQLGNTNITIRLGGIYALERIATDSPPDQRTVVEVLSAFVRERSTDPDLRIPTPAEGDPPPVRPAADIRATVQVLARLPHRNGVPRADFTGADLTGPASLNHLNLTGANLSGVDLVRANLSGAQLGGANLTDARLSGANLTSARELVQGQVDVAVGDGETRLPPGLTRPGSWT